VGVLLLRSAAAAAAGGRGPRKAWPRGGRRRGCRGKLVGEEACRVSGNGGSDGGLEEAVAAAWVKVAADTEAGPADGQRGVAPEE
jgi:hypothetical protein